MTTLVKSFPTHAVRALLVLTVVGLAACTGSSVAETPPASVALGVNPPPVVTLPSAVPSEGPSGEATSPSPDASPAASAEASAVPTSIDPCQLITAEEAGTLAHATFGPGKEETLKGNSKMCTYGAKTKNVFEVIVAIAPDVATAKKQEASAEADLKANAADLEQGMTITKFPGFAPDTDAVLLELKPNTIGVGGRAIYVLRGTSFFGFSDLVLGGSAPSAAAIKAEAMTVLDKLP